VAMKRRTGGIIVLSVLVTAAVIVWLAFLRPSAATQTVEISFYHPFTDASWEAAIAREVREFMQLYPDYPVAVHAAEQADIVARFARKPDAPESSSDDPGANPAVTVAALPSRQAHREAAEANVVAWTGSYWMLYYNKEALSRLGISPELLSGGLDSFETAISRIAEENLTPLSVGARYGWPVAVWIQAFIAASAGADAATPAALAEAATGNSDGTPYRDAVGRFLRYRNSGYVNRDIATSDWIDSVLSVSRGNAAICLINENLISSLDARIQEKLGSTPLPGATDAGWAIGSVLYLAVPAATQPQERQAADAFISFLTSDGTTDRLSRTLPVTFLSQSNRPDTLIPSIASTPDAPIIGVIRRDLGISP